MARIEQVRAGDMLAGAAAIVGRIVLGRVIGAAGAAPQRRTGFEMQGCMAAHPQCAGLVNARRTYYEAAAARMAPVQCALQGLCVVRFSVTHGPVVPDVLCVRHAALPMLRRKGPPCK